MSAKGITTVTSGAHARAAIADVCRVLYESGGVDLGDGSWISIELCTPEELRTMGSAPYCNNPRGMATHSWHRSAGGHIKSDYKIYIERSLPLREFSACCAHELGHIYQYRAYVPRLPAFLSEGLCELFKFTWYAAEGPDTGWAELRRMWANPDPVYGEGFRQALPALIDRRLVDVMTYVQAFGHLPPPLV